MKLTCANTADYRALLGVMLAAWSEDRENRVWLLGCPSRSRPVISPSSHNIWHIIMPALTPNPEDIRNVLYLFHVHWLNLKSFYPRETKAHSSDEYERISFLIQMTLCATVFEMVIFCFKVWILRTCTIYQANIVKMEVYWGVLQLG